MFNDPDTPTDYGEPLPDYFQDTDTRRILDSVKKEPSVALKEAMEEGERIRTEQNELKKEGMMRDLKNFQKGRDTLDMSSRKEKEYNDYKSRKMRKDIARLNLEARGATVKGGKYRRRRRHKKTRKNRRKTKRRRH